LKISVKFRGSYLIWLIKDVFRNVIEGIDEF